MCGSRKKISLPLYILCLNLETLPISYSQVDGFHMTDLGVQGNISKLFKHVAARIARDSCNGINHVWERCFGAVVVFDNFLLIKGQTLLQLMFNLNIVFFGGGLYQWYGYSKNLEPSNSFQDNLKHITWSICHVIIWKKSSYTATFFKPAAAPRTHKYSWIFSIIVLEICVFYCVVPSEWDILPFKSIEFD